MRSVLYERLMNLEKQKEEEEQKKLDDLLNDIRGEKTVY